MRNSALILVAVTLGVLLRLSTVDQVVSGNRIRLLSPDCAYHLRRARFAVRSFPRTILFDPMINFPDGGICVWPPLFDLALAAPARLLHGASATRSEIEKTAAAVPLLFAALAIAAAGVAGLSLRLRYGAAAALFVAFCTGHVHYSQFGQTDQHVAESCWGFWTLGLFLWSSRRHSPAAEIFAALSLTAAVLSWQGAIFWAPLLGLGVIAGFSRMAPLRTIRRSFIVLGLPAVLVAAATAFWLDGFSPPFTYISFGWFQPAFLALTFCVTLAAALLLGWRAISRPARVWGPAILFAALAPLVPVFRRLLAPVREGILHLATRSHGSEVVHGGFSSLPREWLMQIAEYQPLFSDSLWLPAQLLALSFLLSPVVIAIWGLRALRGTRRELNATLCLWGAFTFFITVAQRRNMYYAALLGALAALELGAQAAARLPRFLAPADRRRAPPPIFVAVLAGLSLPMLLGLRMEIRERYVPGEDMFQTMDRLREIVPHPVDAYDPRFLTPRTVRRELAQASSVLAPWSLGHWILYEAETPVAADNFGFGFLDSVRFFLADDEDAALRIARRRRSRFVLADDLSQKMNDYASLLGLPPFSTPTADGISWTRAYFNTLQARLYEFEGLGGRLPGDLEVRPLAHFRLRYASPDKIRVFGRIVSRWKIFEITPGAGEDAAGGRRD